MTTKLDINVLRDLTILGLDTLTMLGDVEDFIEFSESNIGWQKNRELRRAEQEFDDAKFDDPREEAQYQDQTLEGVEFRFEVSLKQRVRYAALTTLITTIEWVLLALKKRTSFTFPDKPAGMSEAVHILSLFNEKAALGLEQKIMFLETLIYIRNCIIHSAGLLASYRHETELRQRLVTLTGVKISDLNFLGDGIEIETGFLEGVIKDVRFWLPNVEKMALERRLLSQRGIKGTRVE